MTDATEHHATCACGQLRITAKGDPDVVTACNCFQCQRRTGSPFGLGAYYPKSRVTAVEGTSKTYERDAPEGRKIKNHFCPDCGTSLYWGLDMRPDHYGIAIGCFADPDFVRPTRVVWAENQHHWVAFPDDMPSFEKAAT